LLVSLAALPAGCQDVQGPSDHARASADYTTVTEGSGLAAFEVVSSGHVTLGTTAIAFQFDAALKTGAIAFPVFQSVRGRPPASGFVQLSFMDGSVRYLAIHSEVSRSGNANDGLTFLLLPYLESGEIDFENPAIANARPSPGTSGGILWHIEGSTVHHGSIAFEVPGSIRLLQITPEPPVPLSFSFHYPLQKVVLQGTGDAGTFSARGNVRQDHSVEGLVELEVLNGKGPIALVPVFGKLDETAPTGPIGPSYTIVFVVEGAPLVNDNVLIAFVQPNPAIPGCDIWDFSSGTVHLDASGVVTVFGTRIGSSAE
jgi:hypothetical protein